MQNEEYWKRKQRKQVLTIATSAVSVLVVIGWVSFYQLPTSESSGPTFFATIQESFRNVEAELGPISLEKTLDDAGNALQNLSESSNGDAEVDPNTADTNTDAKSPSERDASPATNENSNANPLTP